MTHLERLLQDILAKAEAASKDAPGRWWPMQDKTICYDAPDDHKAVYDCFEHESALEHAARLSPPTAIQLVKICRRAVEGLEAVCARCADVADEALAEINELAKGI